MKMLRLPLMLSTVTASGMAAQTRLPGSLPQAPTRTTAECVGVVAPPWRATLDYPTPEVRMPPPPGRGPVEGRAGIFISAAGTLDSVETADFSRRDATEYERNIRKQYAGPPARPATWQGCAVGVWFRWSVLRTGEIQQGMPRIAVDTPRAMRDSIRCAGMVAPAGPDAPQPEIRVAIPPNVRLARGAQGGVFISAAGTLDSVEIIGFQEKDRVEYERAIRKAYDEPKPIRPAIWNGCHVGAWFRWEINTPRR